MDRQGILSNDYYTDDFLGQHQDNIEGADLAHQVDLHGAGILTGLEVTEADPAASMSVAVAAGTAYQGYGRRIRVDVTQSVDCSVDRLAAATVPGAGKERYITLVAVFARQNSAAVLDTETWESISRVQDEYFELQVVSGAEADVGNAVKYTAAAEEVVLADVLLDETTTQITNAMIDDSRRSALDRVESMASFLIGSFVGLAVSRSDDDTLAVTAGWCHLADAAGKHHLVRITADTTLDVAGLSGGGLRYVYVDADGVLSASATPPTRATAKGGWYDAAGNLRFIGSWVFAAGVFVAGQRLADQTVRFDSDVDVGPITANGFTDLDLSAHCPAVSGAVALGSAYGTGYYTYTRLNGSTGTGVLWVPVTGGGSAQGPLTWSEILDASAVIEIDTSNQPTPWRLNGYRDVR